MNTLGPLMLVAFSLGISGGCLAESLSSRTEFNSGIQQMAAEQPEDGVAVTYATQFTGALDGCTAQISETLFPRDEGAWGLFEIASDVTCADGGFAFTSAGSWDAKGFHGAGEITEGSGTGSYDGLSGKLAQSGAIAPAADGTLDIGYDLHIDRTGQADQ